MRKVLIIMEQDCLRDALQKELQQEFEVSVCGNAEDGATLLENRSDILVIDLFLPGTNGLTFLIENKPYLPSIVVVLSVLTSPGILRKLADLGVTSVIRVPCTLDAITSVLKKPHIDK